MSLAEEWGKILLLALKVTQPHEIRDAHQRLIGFPKSHTIGVESDMGKTNVGCGRASFCIVNGVSESAFHDDCECLDLMRMRADEGNACGSLDRLFLLRIRRAVGSGIGQHPIRSGLPFLGNLGAPGGIQLLGNVFGVFGAFPVFWLGGRTLFEGAHIRDTSVRRNAEETEELDVVVGMNILVAEVVLPECRCEICLHVPRRFLIVFVGYVGLRFEERGVIVRPRGLDFLLSPEGGNLFEHCGERMSEREIRLADGCGGAKWSERRGREGGERAR